MGSDGLVTGVEALAKHKVAGSTPVTRSQQVAQSWRTGLGNRFLCTAKCVPRGEPRPPLRVRSRCSVYASVDARSRGPAPSTRASGAFARRSTARAGAAADLEARPGSFRDPLGFAFCG